MVKYRIVLKERQTNEDMLPELKELDCTIKSMAFKFDGTNDAAVYEVPSENILEFEDKIIKNPNTISFKRIL